MKTSVVRLCLSFLLVGSALSNGGCHHGEPSSGGSADAGTAATTSAVGIAECDEYLAKVYRCIATHVPSDRKKPLEDALSRNRIAWAAMAANPGTRPALGDSCRLALQTAQTTMQSFSCDW